MRILVVEDDLEAQRYLVKGLKEAGHVVDEASEGEGFTHAGIAGEEEDAAPAFNVIKTSEAFLKGFGVHGFLGLDIFIKRESFQAEPGEEFFHGITLPLWKEKLVWQKMNGKS